jgi:hypothetical protein
VGKRVAIASFINAPDAHDHEISEVNLRQMCWSIEPESKEVLLLLQFADSSAGGYAEAHAVAAHPHVSRAFKFISHRSSFASGAGV